MKIKFIAVSLCMAMSVNFAKAGNETDSSVSNAHKHEIRLMASDGLTQTGVNVLGIGLADAVLGSKRSDEKASMVYGVGYRYSLGRFKVGGDLGFAYNSSKLTLAGESTPSIKERELTFMTLPTGEFTYYKKGLIELYGAAAAGVSLSRHTESGLNQTGNKQAQKSSLSTSFAYQVTPIAVRVGNERIGGFVEAGFGHKGFLTAGLSMRF